MLSDDTVPAHGVQTASCPVAARPAVVLPEDEMRRAIFALFLFGITFGYVEASVVVYLRTIYEPLRQRISPRPPDELFPLITTNQLREAGPENTRRLLTELGREAATLLMLAAIGLAVADTFQHWAAAFLIAFGVWDIFFYLFLKLLIDWPRSLLTWDLLFLIPVPWVGPVAAPVIVSLSMIVCGLIVLHRPVNIRPKYWTGIVFGGSIVVVSFCLDYANLLRGGLPNPFHWGVFLTGELIGVASFAAAAGSSGSPEFQTQRGFP